MSYVTVEQIQRLDKMATEKYGIPSIVLMENAGRAVAEEVLKDLQRGKHRRVTIICGVGNNAGDGFVTARHLWNAGVDPTVFLIGEAGHLKQDAAVNYRILKNCGYPVSEIRGKNLSLKRHLAKTDIIVDAIFGVGLNRQILEPFQSVIELSNDSCKRTIAVDVPSGLDATTGKICGVCIQADKTVTFSFSKKGFFVGEGPRMTGKVIVADIGIPGRIMKNVKYPMSNIKLDIDFIRH